MRVRFGIAPLFIILAVAGTLTVSAGGYVGLRYYRADTLAKRANALFDQGRYEEAATLYKQSKAIWSRGNVPQQLDRSQEMMKMAAAFTDGLNSFSEGNWEQCVARLQGIGSRFYRYNEVETTLRDCEAKRAEQLVATNQPSPSPSTSPTATPAETKSTIAKEKSTQKTASASSPTASVATPSSSPAASPSSAASTSTSACRSNANPTFTSHITDMSKVSGVAIPPRLMGTDLKTHSYIETNKARVPVYAPAALTLTGGVYLLHADGAIDYGLDLQVSCEVWLRFGHITEPVQSIKDAFGSTPQANSMTNYNVPHLTFSAGDLIGYTTGTTAAGNWDFGVYNSTVKNRYAATYSSNIVTTAVCPFDYFTSSLRESYAAKYIRDFGTSTTDGPFFCD